MLDTDVEVLAAHFGLSSRMSPVVEVAASRFWEVESALPTYESLFLLVGGRERATEGGRGKRREEEEEKEGERRRGKLSIMHLHLCVS